MEAVLMALCGCTSVDVVSILQKKRQPLTALRVSATAEQAPTPPRVFTQIKLTYCRERASVSRKAVEDAVALSKEKYCSVSKMLEKAAAIEFEIVLVDGEAAAMTSRAGHRISFRSLLLVMVLVAVALIAAIAPCTLPFTARRCRFPRCRE